MSLKYYKSITALTDFSVEIGIQVFLNYGKAQGKANPHLVQVTYQGVVTKSREFDTITLSKMDWLKDLEKEIQEDFRAISTSIYGAPVDLSTLLMLEGFEKF